MVLVAGAALGGSDDLLIVGKHFAFRAMTGVAVVDSGHENVGSEPALGGVMAIIALHHRVAGVVEG